MTTIFISLLLLFTGVFLLWYIFRSIFSSVPSSLRKYLETRKVTASETGLKSSALSNTSRSVLLNDYEKYLLFLTPRESEALIDRIHSHHLNLLDQLSTLSQSRSSLGNLPLIEGLLTHRYELLGHYYHLFKLQQKVSKYHASIKQESFSQSLKEVNIDLHTCLDELKSNESAIKKELFSLVSNIEKSLNHSISNIH